MSKFNFDFINVDDLPEEIKQKFVGEVSENAKRVADILNDPACPASLNITQVMAVYTRAYGPVPTAATFRAWLNKAVAGGLISKPTKQTYGPAGGPSVADDEPGVEGAEGVEVDSLDDPLSM